MIQTPTTRPQMPLVVVIEDEKLIRETFEMALSLEGYAVRSFPNGQDALDWLKQSPEVLFIVLDLMMPVMDGTEFMKHFKALPSSTAQAPVILCSASAEAHDFKQMGCSAFLSKPVNFDKLRRIYSQFI